LFFNKKDKAIKRTSINTLIKKSFNDFCFVLHNKEDKKKVIQKKKDKKSLNSKRIQINHPKNLQHILLLIK